MEVPINHYDVIVAGGGPAGASAAYFLTLAGKKVLLLEKANLPRYKACGGGLSLEFLRSQFPFDFSPVIDRFATHIHYHFNGFEVPVRCRPGTLAMVKRDKFDHFLVQQCGADVMEGEAVRDVIRMNEGIEVITSSGNHYFADWLIGADGANSIVRNRIGFKPIRKEVTAIEVEVTPPAELMKRFASGPVFIFEKLRFGYLWIFPKANSLSVGVADLNPKAGALQAALKRVMAKYGISLEGVIFHGHPLPVYTRNLPVCSKRVLLVGDAAGLVDPFSGEGIRIAIKSGRIAAEAILKGDAGIYQKRIRVEIGRDRLQSWWVAQFFYRLRFLCLFFGTSNPFATDLVLDLLADRITTAGLLALAIATLPAFLVLEIIGWFVGVFGGQEKRNHFLNGVYPYSG